MVVVGLLHSLLSGPLAGRRDLGRVRETLLQFQGPPDRALTPVVKCRERRTLELTPSAGF